MGYIVNVIRIKEVNCYDPRTWTNDIINPFTMLQYFSSFKFILNNFSFFLNCLFITTNTNNQMNMFEKFLSLFKNFCVSNMVHIKNTISINSYWIVWICPIRDSWSYHSVIIFWQTIWKIFDFIRGLWT